MFIRLWQENEIFRIAVVFAGVIVVLMLVRTIKLFREDDYESEGGSLWLWWYDFTHNTKKFTKRLLKGIGVAIALLALLAAVFLLCYIESFAR